MEPASGSGDGLRELGSPRAAAVTALTVLAILNTAASLLELALRAVEAGKRTVTKEDGDAAGARREEARKGRCDRDRP